MYMLRKLPVACHSTLSSTYWEPFSGLISSPYSYVCNFFNLIHMLPTWLVKFHFMELKPKQGVNGVNVI